MKILYIAGLANHIGPESCIFVRKDEGEALTGERTYRLGIEPRNHMPRHEAGYFGVPTPCRRAEGEIWCVVLARRSGTLRGRSAARGYR